MWCWLGIGQKVGVEFEKNITVMQGGHGMEKKDPGSIFFEESIGLGLTKYVSRR